MDDGTAFCLDLSGERVTLLSRPGTVAVAILLRESRRGGERERGRATSRRESILVTGKKSGASIIISWKIECTHSGNECMVDAANSSICTAYVFFNRIMCYRRSGEEILNISQLTEGCNMPC